MSDAKVAIITGATGGIGTAILRKLGGMGMRLVGTGRSAEKLEQLKQDIGPGIELSTIIADVTEDDAPQRIVRHALDTYGRIDFLINNAGAGKWAPVHATDDKTLDEVLNTSLRAVFRLSREVLPHLKPGSGIVMVGSTFGILGGLDGGAYCAAKAGMIGLAQTMAAQYGPDGIRTNVVAPGVVRTAMTDAYWDADFFRRINHEMTPFDRECTVEDVANLVGFLCSDEGSYINGQTLALDGGWSTTKYLAKEALLAQRVPPVS